MLSHRSFSIVFNSGEQILDLIAKGKCNIRSIKVKIIFLFFIFILFYFNFFYF